ncbi:MAG: argininosuccinate synthase [Bdellovibrionaceae bacterium]|jgi:argininosuccinate synthase|nr:argininosuccinate synthase [Pseudobdellovibrionaceae bacterium]
MKKILLAYSGGLDTSAIIPWLKENYNAEVIAYCCDVGNQPNEQWLEERALKFGASQFIFEDLKEEYVKNYVYPLLRAGATYQEDYLLGTAIARPLIAERMAWHATQLGATAIAHGATGKGNDQLRFEKAWAYLVPKVEVIAPWKIWNFKGRKDLQNYLMERGFEVETTSTQDENRFSVDANLYHVSTEGDSLENVEQPYLDKLPVFTNSSMATNSQLSFKFEKGILVSLKLINSSVAELSAASPPLSHSDAENLVFLNKVGKQHQIGIIDIVEERMNGIKSRGIYQTPGGSIIKFALGQLKQICWNKGLYKTSQSLGDDYGQSVYDGEWHSELRYSLENFFERAALQLSGEVELQLIGSKMAVNKRISPYSLYNQSHVSFEEDTLDFNENAKGFSLFATYPSQMAGKAKAQLQ